MKPNRPLAILAATTAAACGWARDAIEIDARTAFSGPGGDTSAVRVTLTNNGPDAHGSLRVLGADASAVYPVDLPSGGRQSILTLNGPDDGRYLQFVLDTNRGREVQGVPSSSRDHTPGGSAVLIGDDRDGLSFLRQKETEGKSTLQGHDAYVSPEDAPARSAAYRTYDAVVLGPGAERIDDATVAALKEYALAGGTLVLLGGWNSVAISDSRWADLSPAKAWRRTASMGPALADLGKAPIPSAFRAIVPTALATGATSVKGADGESTFDTERGMGLGKVVVLGYSPLERPLNEWPGRMHAFARFIRGGDALRANRFTETYLNRTVGGGMTYRYNTGSTPEAPVTQLFSTKLPPTKTICGLLVGYFVLVVPVSFLVLRRMKRGELAWITAPLLSLGFAGALFGSARALYSAKLSTGSQGVLVFQEGSPEAMFFGTSQMFFPHGGSYDLKMRDIDSMTAVGESNGYGSDALAGFNIVDVGHVEVRNLEASNLAFREMSYSQRLSDADWFGIRTVDAHHTEVANRSPYRFHGSLASGSETTQMFDLAPGETKTVDTTHRAVRLDDGKNDLAPESPLNFTRHGGRIALSGFLKGFRPGPQIGHEVHNDVDVIAFAQEKTR